MSEKTRPALVVASMTHRGALREENQDALCVAGAVRTGDMRSPEVLEARESPLLLAVIDGMGGHEGGEKAARVLAETLAGGAVGVFGVELDLEEDERNLRSLLDKAALRMDADVRRNPALGRMGATVSGVLIREKTALCFNCGDCRVYRLSGGELERLTRDHSIVQALYEKGEIAEDEMRVHPQKSVVTSAVSAGSAGAFELYTKAVSRCESDVFFLCSDGVWEAMGSRQLTQRLTRPSGTTLADAAKEFFDSLLAAGCRDNVSFLWQES
ncbi:MAG: serine/threonine-protein phosphatase [Synergistaceae bacterium]|jgi:serine/threonine protein phosphatase PrpC|nr:serine/threonine-protein phosphatase [Synergistaceae bacterium]